MLNKIFGQKIVDKHFDDLRVAHDSEAGIFTMTKTIDFGIYKKIDLYLENQLAESTDEQFNLFNIILNNSSQILSSASKIFFDDYKTDLFKDFDLEFIVLNDKDSLWELWLKKKGRFEQCLVEFDGLKSTWISFQA